MRGLWNATRKSSSLDRFSRVEIMKCHEKSKQFGPLFSCGNYEMPRQKQAVWTAFLVWKLWNATRKASSLDRFSHVEIMKCHEKSKQFGPLFSWHFLGRSVKHNVNVLKIYFLPKSVFKKKTWKILCTHFHIKLNWFFRIGWLHSTATYV